MQNNSTSAIQLEIGEDSIARINLNQPNSRVNTLNQSMWSELEEVMTQLENRPEIKGLILCSSKPGIFIAGADLRELGGGQADSDLTRKLVARGLSLIARLEKLPFPTVALIDGACMGGGLELAMGCDYRLASNSPKTELALPEVKIGLIPGWGGTQRLSRLIGPSLAAEMICSGEGARPTRAFQLGLVFDVLPADQLFAEAVRFIHHSIKSSDWRAQRNKKQLSVGMSEEQLSFAFAVTRTQILAKTGSQFPAPIAAVDVILKGSNLPLAEGLKIETNAFVPLVGSPISTNLIAIFFMNQRLSKDVGVTDTDVKPATVGQVGVVGAGLMGAGIAGACIRKGIPTVMFDSSGGALEKGVLTIGKVLQTRIEIGRATQTDMNQALGLLSTSRTSAAFGDRDLVIEAIVENEAAKAKLFEELQNVVSPDAILTSNTSTISITRLAGSVNKPENFAGLHFFNPVDRMQLVEVIRGSKTSDATVVTLVALAKRLGKTPIVVKDCPGFLVNRILFPYMNEALLMLEEGASARQIDKVATAFGMPMGPIALNDLVGLDTSYHAGSVINKAFADRGVNSRILPELIKAGRLGQKSGAGFYNYTRGTRGTDDPVLETLLAGIRKEKRDFSTEEITDRLFLPMLTEASRVLMEGIVRDPSDVDMGLILGTGFPTFRGGLLRWADQIGLSNIMPRLSRMEKLGIRFVPTEQIHQLASTGKGFYRNG